MGHLRLHYRKAFSLLEVIITIVVLGLLASIAFVGYGAVVTRAATSSTEASLRHIDSAVDVTHAMRTAIDGGPRIGEDFATAAYGIDGTGDSEISSSTGTWDLVKADSSDASFDESTVYYALSGGVTGMAKTVIDSSPDGNRYHLSFLKSSFAQTVTWSAWCEITPADLLNLDPGARNWPHPDCRFEGTFQNNPGNASPAEITDAGTVSPAQEGAFVSSIQFDGYADYVVYTFTPISDDRPSATTPAETVVSPNYPVPSSGETVSGLIPGVNYTVEAALYFNDPLYGPGLEDAAQLVDESDAPQTVRPYTVPAAPSVTAELIKDNGSADFDATVTVSWADIYTGSAESTGFTPTDVMNFRVEQSIDGGSSFSVVTSTSTPNNEITPNAGVYSVVVDAVADSVMTFRVVAINDSGLESSTDSGDIAVGNIPAVATPIAPTVDPNTLGQNAAYGYDFAWTADPESTSVEYSLNGGTWQALSGTSGNITGNSSPFATVTVEVRAKVYSSNDYGSVESDWVSDGESFTFEGPNDDVATLPSAPVINTDDTAYNYTYAFDFDWSNVGADEQECRYDGGSWVPCSGTTWTGTGSANSEHTLRVRVRNTGIPHPIYGGGVDSAWVYSLDGTSNRVSRVQFGGPPAQVGTYECTETVDTTPDVTCDWPNVSGATYYESRFRNNGSWSGWTSTGSTSSRQITSVGLNQTFAHRARACNDYGCGSYREDTEVINGPPAQVGSYECTETVDSTPDVACDWPNVSFPSSSGTNYYQSSFNNSNLNNSSWTSWTSTGTTSYRNITSVAKSQTFGHRARACNGYGCGSYRQDNETIGNVPGVPTGLSMTLHGFSSTTSTTSANACTRATWNSVSGASSYYYHQAWVWQGNVGTSRTRDHCGLNYASPSDQWRFEVSACNGYGCSARSSWKYADRAPIVRDAWFPYSGNTTMWISWHENSAHGGASGNAYVHYYYGSSCQDSRWATYSDTSNDGWHERNMGSYASDAGSWYSGYMSVKMGRKAGNFDHPVCNSARYVVVW